jgi:hypothetical protein
MMSQPPVSTRKPPLKAMMSPMPSTVPATAKGIVATTSSAVVSEERKRVTA